jgi:prepilin-type N-terminal cleavage/methylation domain-containing protein
MNMVRLIAARASQNRSEEGFTLVEVLVAMMMLSIVFIVFAGVLVTVQNATNKVDRRSQNNDTARLAMERLDHEIRSANFFYDPSVALGSIPAGYGLKIYTQTNAPTRTPSPGYLCVMYQITATGELQSRYWPPSQPSLASSWETIATGIVNRLVSPNVSAFSLDTDTNKGYRAIAGTPTTYTSRAVNIILLANQYLSTNATSTVRQEAALAGRNTSFGFPPTYCSVNPS